MVVLVGNQIVVTSRLRGYVSVLDKIYCNLPNRNFVRAIATALGSSDTTIYSASGDTWNLSGLSSVNPAFLRVSADTTSPSYTEINVPNPIRDLSASYNLRSLGNGYVFSMNAYTEVDFQTVGIVQVIAIYTGYGTAYRNYLLARALAYVPAGQGFSYNIYIQHPYNYNFARFIYGWLSDTTINMTSIDGTTCSWSSDSFSAPRRGDIILSDEDVDDSVNRLTLSSYTSIRTIVAINESSNSVWITIYGSFTPQTQYTIRLVGLSIYNCNKQNLIMLKRLDNPVTVQPGETRVIAIKMIF